jgi:DNA-binding PadR family transcriptional regulator
MARRRNTSPQTQAMIAALLEAPQAWRHGYELSKLTGLKSGTLYPLLMRLSDQGLLESRWEPSAQAGRPPRHVYRLTVMGATLARAQAAARDDNGFVEPLGDPA